MANIRMVRVDYRLVHGQIVAKWIKFRPVDRLVLVDDALVNDDFMADIYRMSAGGKDVDITTVADVRAALDKGNDAVMLIFKDVDGAHRAFKDGLDLPELNVGAVQSAKGRKTVMQGVALSPEEYEKLLEIQAAGVNVYLQPIPESPATSLGSIASKVR